MFWPFNSYKRRKDHYKDTEPEVNDIKAKFNRTSTKTKKDVDRLNCLLKANGITLKIHIAAGGHHG